MTQPLVAITGAGGALGGAVAEAFLVAGYRVKALARADADVCDRDAVRRAIAGADCVVHLAAMLHVVDPSPALGEEYRRVNVGGTENVVRAVESEGVRRLVHASTIAVYGYDEGRLLTEEDEPNPSTQYAITKLESERLVLADRGTVLRFGAVYGARVKGNYRRLLRSLDRGRFVPIGTGLNRRTLVYDRDVARAAVVAAQHRAAPGQVFNVTDGSIHTVREVLAAMSFALGRRPPRLSLPVAPVRFGAHLVEIAAGLAHVRAPMTRSTIDKYVEDVMVSGDKARTQLGFVASYDLARGWAETVDLMRQSGELLRPH